MPSNWRPGRGWLVRNTRKIASQGAREPSHLPVIYHGFAVYLSGRGTKDRMFPILWPGFPGNPGLPVRQSQVSARPRLCDLPRAIVAISSAHGDSPNFSPNSESFPFFHCPALFQASIGFEGNRFHYQTYFPFFSGGGGGGGGGRGAFLESTKKRLRVSATPAGVPVRSGSGWAFLGTAGVVGFKGRQPESHLASTTRRTIFVVVVRMVCHTGDLLLL